MRDDPQGRRADPAQAADRWDNGRDVVLAGDAAGVVAPSSGEGIYYAMVGGRVAATAARPRWPRAG
jgi:geranylgeranyl reductase